MDNVNLDALIPREDFEVQDEKQLPQLSQTIKISDLEEAAFFYTALRKPDFQRETSDWDPDISRVILQMLFSCGFLKNTVFFVKKSHLKVPLAKNSPQTQNQRYSFVKH